MGITDDIERELSTDHRARQRAREDVLLRFMELSWQDQFKTYKVMQGYFIHSGAGSEAWREVQERGGCVEAMQRVARHLGLPEGEAPGVEAYQRGRKELGLALSSSAIIRRWGSWSEASKAARGEKVAMTARQRAHFRAAIGRRRHGEEWLAGVREWLATNPPSLCRCDYNGWVVERNEERPDAPPVCSAESVYSALGLTWPQAMKVARGRLSLAEAQAKELQRLKEENGEFVSSCAVALILGITIHRTKFVVNDPAFPPHVFMLRGRRIWHLRDIEAHHKGKPYPRREPGELEAQVMDSPAVGRLCGLSKSDMNHAVTRGRAIIPPANGRVGGLHFWFRAEVEAWAAGHPEHIH